MLRIAHVVTHPIQYFAPLYREIAQDDDIRLTVLFGSDFGTRPSFDPGLSRVVQFDTPLLDGFDHEFLNNSGDGNPGPNPASFDCPGLSDVLIPARFDAVWIHGWGYRFQRQAAAAARKAGLPYFVRGESTLLEAPLFSRRWLGRYLKHGRFLRRAAACLYVGQQNRRFLESMGAPDSKLFPAHYSVDANSFSKAALSPAERAAFRETHSADDETTVIATIAKLIPRKRVDDLVRAVGMAGPKVRLWVLGDGVQSQELQSLANQVAPGQISWFGFTNQQDLPRVLSAADVFALASDEETWGLVVNEAMACGLPAVVSDRIGCAADLVREGETGFVYPCGDIRRLAHQLAELSQNRVGRQAFGHAARDHVLAHYSVQATSRQIVAAFQSVLTRADRP